MLMKTITIQSKKYDNVLKPQSLLRVEGTAHARVRWDSREIIAAVDFLPR